MTHGHDTTNGNLMLRDGYAPEEKRKEASSYVQLMDLTYDVEYTHIDHDRETVQVTAVYLRTGLDARNITETADYYGITADLIELL